MRTSHEVHTELDALRVAFRLTRNEELLDQIRALIVEATTVEQAEFSADMRQVHSSIEHAN